MIFVFQGRVVVLYFPQTWMIWNSVTLFILHLSDLSVRF